MYNGVMDSEHSMIRASNFVRQVTHGCMICTSSTGGIVGNGWLDLDHGDCMHMILKKGCWL